jgi:hypothetical protein
MVVRVVRARNYRAGHTRQVGSALEIEADRADPVTNPTVAHLRARRAAESWAPHVGANWAGSFIRARGPNWKPLAHLFGSLPNFILFYFEFPLINSKPAI